MDSNLMVLNVGNSRLAVAVFVAGELHEVVRIAHEDRTKWPAVVSKAWAQVSDLENSAVAGASVNPAIMESLEHAVTTATGEKVQWVGRELDLPIPVRTDEPKATGVDRVLNVAAAYEQMGKACAVVDAGTAITIDLCNDAGEFLGGAIAPGASTMLRSLHEQTARLPLVALEKPDGLVGKSTEQAIRHGVYHGLRGMVKEIVENYATELGTWPDLIATGGDAPALFEGWELVHAIAPDLTLYGIALAHANHQLKDQE